MKKRIKNHLLIPYVSIAFIIISLVLQPFGEFITGYIHILTSESILLTDYIVVGGEGPALFNAGSLMLLTYLIIRKLDLRVTGSIFAGILTIGGFAFFGKNLLNVSIIYLGVYLYAKYKSIDLRSVIAIFLFSTGLSPISSIVFFGLGLSYAISIPLGIFIGILSGFLLVELSQKVITFHRGYDLYNVGFASGIIAFVFFSVLKLFSLDYETNLIYTNESHSLLLIIFVSLALIYILVGLWLNDFKLTGYKDILRQSGIAITDFTRRKNEPMTMFNIGLTSLASLALMLLIGVKMSGPVMGGLLTIMGFAAFGKHLRNSIPPMIGVILVVYLFKLELSVPVILAIIFSTGLAPVSGEYGIIVGVLTGMLHLPVVQAISELHGGILLYSNGFAAAFTAVIITTLITSIKKEGFTWGFMKN